MASITVLIVEKNGEVKEQVVKSYDEAELYKKAGFKTADGFKCYATWGVEDLDDKNYSIFLVSKNNSIYQKAN